MSSEQCQYYVVKKKRNCRMLVKTGHRFCGEHSNEISNQEGLPCHRIPCPYDPKHTCNANKLEKHMLKCVSKPKELPTYCLPGINNSNDDDDDDNDNYIEDDDGLKISTTDDDLLMDVIRRIKTLYRDRIESNVRTRILSHDILKQELENLEYGPNKLKHLRQNSSLLGHAEESGFFDDSKSTIIEFGSGRGQLSYWSTQIDSAKSKTYILVDKASHRHKFDNRLKDDNDIDIQRIRIDISDLVLSEIPCLNPPIVGISKHLCGSATDLTLRCLVRATVPIRGFIIALCCHHKCTWKSYVGKPFFKSTFQPREFSLIRGLTSWATCGSGKSRNHVGQDSTNIDRYAKLGLDQMHREEIGKMAKRVLDFGRMDYVQKHMKQLQVQLNYYVSTDVSPENVVLLAK